MKKVLGIVSSPRKLGNCEVFVKDIFMNIPGENQLKLIRLSDFEIKPCRGCYRCLVNNEPCDIKDGFLTIQNALIDCDAIILASPTYFLSANSLVKLLLDRGLSLYCDINKILGKPSIGIGFAGIEGKDGYTELGIQSFLKSIMSNIKYTGIIHSAFPGEVFLSEDNQILARELGEILFSDKSLKMNQYCPVCRGNSFKFLPNNKAQCLLCSNSGTYSIENGQIEFKISTDQHGLFLSPAHAEDHRKWLLKMKTDFQKSIPTLKIIRDKYKNVGDWVKSCDKAE